MHVSNFRPVKRVDAVLDVFIAASARACRAQLVMIGDGPERARRSSGACSTRACRAT